MIGANHPFQVRSLNALDENGNEGCASCGRTRDAHPAAAQSRPNATYELAGDAAPRQASAGQAGDVPSMPTGAYGQWFRIVYPKASDGTVAQAWRGLPAAEREFWRSLASPPTPARDDAGTIRHAPTNATWVTWDDGRQPPWHLVDEAVGRLTGGAVKVRACRRDEDEPGRLAVAVYRDLPELEEE